MRIPNHRPGIIYLNRRFLLLCAVLTVAGQPVFSADDYSGWNSTNDPRIQYRWRAMHYFSKTDGDCDMQLRYAGPDGRPHKIQYELNYDYHGDEQRKATIFVAS